MFGFGRQMGEVQIEDKGPGLAKGWAIGETLAWKGIVFLVESVEFDRLTLKVKGVTKRRAAEMMERMRA